MWVSLVPDVRQLGPADGRGYSLRCRVDTYLWWKGLREVVYVKIAPLFRYHRWNACAGAVCLVLLLAAHQAVAGQPKLTPLQLIALTRAAKERFWSVSYTAVAKAYQGIATEKPLPKNPDSLSRDVWLWTPWMSHRRLYRHILTAGIRGAYRQVSGFDGTTARWITVAGPSGGAGHIEHRGPLRGCIVDQVWSPWYFRGDTNTNSTVSWNKKLGEYVLDTVAQGGQLHQKEWVDPRRAFVVTREESTKNGAVFMEDRYWRWRKVSPGHWLPMRFSTFVPKIATVVNRITTDPQVNAFIPRGDLRVAFPAGIRVFDGITGKLGIAGNAGTRR